MLNLLGEYQCKLDAKGRLGLPSGLRKQLGEAEKMGFVLNRDIFEACLVLYPSEEWKKISKQVAGLNRFVKKNAMFIRRFNNGATPVELDASARINMPPRLMEYAGLEKEVIVIGNGERIEIWDKAKYESFMDEDVDFASLSEEVMGGLDQDVDA
ncbi:division/cell wall cluster transcriptional repressor MraZ [Luteibaculum oceani]|uniref:Transcriptional regulator MraZ n=1 Tax=Luteibaculum oceani TaxID=1294296 RepID=A0A5C6UZR7_9FLAO|nr:division/cell wall cluster transcriptional repressor MraZ [Luteibaculum oceani]TXC78882.1 division/cell wall cluster transcriptional repressor MraZ [Luteibaculum oceani]